MQPMLLKPSVTVRNKTLPQPMLLTVLHCTGDILPKDGLREKRFGIQPLEVMQITFTAMEQLSSIIQIELRCELCPQQLSGHSIFVEPSPAFLVSRAFQSEVGPFHFCLEGFLRLGAPPPVVDQE